MSDVLLWLGGNGAFNTPSKWNDVTTLTNPSIIAPGALDFAIITGTAGQVIDGPGTAGFLEVLTNTTFTGALLATGQINETGPTGDYQTAFQVRSNSTATFDTGSTLTVTNENVLIGVTAEAGHLVLKGGADMSIDVTDPVTSMKIGGTAGSAIGSTVLIDGAGTTLTVDAGIQVGSGSDGSLTVSNNAQLSIGDAGGFEFLVGAADNAKGTFTLSGGADLVMSTATASTIIGNSSKASGTVIVKDAGTTWQDHSITVGSSGKGTLSIENQANVSTTDMLVGSLATGDGSVVVKDAGTLLTTTTLELAGGSADGGTGNLTVQGGALVNVGSTLQLWGDGSLTIQTGGTVDVGTPGAPVAGSLNIEANGLVEGTGTINPAIVNNGTLEATDFGLALTDKTLNIKGAITGTGTIITDGAAILEVAGSVASTQTVRFDDTKAGNASLSILAAGAAGFGATIASFDKGDTIRLVNTLGAQASFDAASNVLTVKDYFGATVASLTLTDHNDPNTFVAFSDGANGTIIKIDDGSNLGPPQFTNNGGAATVDINVVEERPLGFGPTTLTSSDPDNTIPHYQIVGGADMSKFVLFDLGQDGLTFDLRFAQVADFEAPADANHDNIYDVVVAVSDNAGGFDLQTIHVHVQNAPNPLLGTAQNDNLIGTNEAEKIFGLARNDVLQGFGGKDVLVGGNGRDTMFGGGAGDVFDFNAVNETGKSAATRDQIVDFSHSEHDKIDLATIDASSKIGGNQAFKFIGKQAFHHTAGELHQVTLKGGDVGIEGDTNGDGKADFQIQLVGLFLDSHTLVKGDFAL